MNLASLLLGFICGGALAASCVFLWMRKAANTTLEREREIATDKLRFLEQTREDMSLRFKQLSQEILEDKARRFTQQNQQNLEQILKPLREKISGFEQQVKETYDKENRVRIELVQQIGTLQKLNQQVSDDARNLAVALRGESKTQGAWGEMILEKILEASGLVRGREYETQFSSTGDDGKRYRPDAIVHLPEGRDLIVDAKVSLTAYVRGCEATDENARRQALAEHVQSLRSHIRLLSEKNYQSLENVRTLDFVLMFIPSESAFIEAIRAEPGLYDEALKRNISLVSASTLLPTLRTVEYLWKIERQNRNAQKIAEDAGRLYDQFVLFESALSGIGDALGKAQQSYDTARKRLVDGRGNLVGRVEKLKDMGAASTKQLPDELLAGLDDRPAALADASTSKVTPIKA